MNSFTLSVFICNVIKVLTDLLIYFSGEAELFLDMSSAIVNSFYDRFQLNITGFFSLIFVYTVVN